MPDHKGEHFLYKECDIITEKCALLHDPGLGKEGQPSMKFGAYGPKNTKRQVAALNSSLAIGTELR
jgi:hypothetical protein